MHENKALYLLEHIKDAIEAEDYPLALKFVEMLDNAILEMILDNEKRSTIQGTRG